MNPYDAAQRYADYFGWVITLDLLRGIRSEVTCEDISEAEQKCERARLKYMAVPFEMRDQLETLVQAGRTTSSMSVAQETST